MLLISSQPSYSHKYYRSYIARIFEQLIRPKKQMLFVPHRSQLVDPMALELRTTKEILPEVFSIRTSDVDEMIQNLFDDVSLKEDGL